MAQLQNGPMISRLSTLPRQVPVFAFLDNTKVYACHLLLANVR